MIGLDRVGCLGGGMVVRGNRGQRWVAQSLDWQRGFCFSTSANGAAQGNALGCVGTEIAKPQRGRP